MAMTLTGKWTDMSETGARLGQEGRRGRKVPVGALGLTQWSADTERGVSCVEGGRGPGGPARGPRWRTCPGGVAPAHSEKAAGTLGRLEPTRMNFICQGGQC